MTHCLTLYYNLKTKTRRNSIVSKSRMHRRSYRTRNGRTSDAKFEKNTVHENGQINEIWLCLDNCPTNLPKLQNISHSVWFPFNLYSRNSFILEYLYERGAGGWQAMR